MHAVSAFSEIHDEMKQKQIFYIHTFLFRYFSFACSDQSSKDKEVDAFSA